MATQAPSRRRLRPFRNQDSTLRRMLTGTQTIAMVGASDKQDRPSNEVMSFLLDHGYRVIPINPRLKGQELMGETVLASLEELPQVLKETCKTKKHALPPVSSTKEEEESTPSTRGVMVDIFRRADSVGEIVDQAIALGHDIVSSIWMQIGVVDESAARRAQDAGFDVAMNTCPVEEIPRLGIGVSGTTTNSAARKKPKGQVREPSRKRVMVSTGNDESINQLSKASRGKRRNCR